MAYNENFCPVDVAVVVNTNRNSVRHVTVDERSEGQRIDNFLLRELKGAPRALVYRILRKGEVRVNKGRVKVGRKLRIGDVVRIPPVRLTDAKDAGKPGRHSLENIEKQVLYEDDLIIVLNKPSGVAVHGGSGISFGVIELLRASRPEARGLELVHRLDRDTSGCLMVAKKRSALRILHELQLQGQVQKRYLALLHGVWSKNFQRVQVRLKKNTLRSGERVVRVDPEGKSAHTEFRVVERFVQATLVEARLHTGRTHQIRVHAQYLGTPILGDEKYTDDALNAKYRSMGLKRLFLHAYQLRFPWPGSEREYAIQAPLSHELEAVLRRLRAA